MISDDNEIKVPVLPDLPSALIRVAVRDLEAVEQDERYIVDMETWHDPSNVPDVCSVCLAGAVIARAGNSPMHNISPFNFESIDVRFKLCALDSFRSGDIAVGVAYMYMPGRNTMIKDRDITEYDLDPARFKREMLVLADDLEREGN